MLKSYFLDIVTFESMWRQDIQFDLKNFIHPYTEFREKLRGIIEKTGSSVYS